MALNPSVSGRLPSWELPPRRLRLPNAPGEKRPTDGGELLGALSRVREPGLALRCRARPAPWPALHRGRAAIAHFVRNELLDVSVGLGTGVAVDLDVVDRPLGVRGVGQLPCTRRQSRTHPVGGATRVDRPRGGRAGEGGGPAQG